MLQRIKEALDFIEIFQSYIDNLFQPYKNIKIIIKYLKNNINLTNLQDNDGVDLVEQHEDGVVSPRHDQQAGDCRQLECHVCSQMVAG